ncbi:glycoside hydrolase superfamily [Mycena metata]|uniref:Glycoside hydrolase superfamily n=1 Tax=Mycena metata TaxID=1033252 RepID=A0AAD7NLL4_9AGAR|nr:glycoside hydrolase superfamily [Mycena metata]
MPALPTTRIDIRQLPMVDQPDNCHLLQLPLELRERIYEHILGRLINFELLPGDFPGMSASIRTSWCYLPVDDLDRIPIHTMFRAESAALSPQFLLSCRQAYIEALPILHQRNTFRFPADYLATVVSGALGSYCLPDIRSVYLQSLYYSHDHGDPSNTVVTLLQQMNVSRLAFDFQFFPIPEPQSPWGRTVLEFRNLRRLEMWGDNQDVVSKFQQLMIGPGADEKTPTRSSIVHPIAFLSLCATFLGSTVTLGQQIFDIRQTLHDQSQLFSVANLSKPASFSQSSSSSANIVIDDKTPYQTLKGFGATLTDSGAQSLSNLEMKNADAYSELLQKLFNPALDASSAGITYLRVPLAATDFSETSYSFDDTPGDTTLSKFNIDASPSYLFGVLKDIQDISNIVKVHVVPWSTPGWMKDSKKVNGGNFVSNMSSIYAQYLLKALQGFESKGINLYAISIQARSLSTLLQNEPLNSNPTLPSCKMTYEDEGAIGTALRPLMKANGFSAVQLIAFEHNWESYTYPISVMKDYEDVFDGVAFHCYGGTVADQDKFVQAYLKKDVYFTECTGMEGSNWWSDIQWQTENIYMGAIEHSSQTALMWSLISGDELPGSTSCHSKAGKPNACRAVVTVNSDSGTYVLNQEYYGIAHAAHAILPNGPGGAFGQLIKSTVEGSRAAHLRVTAYATPGANATAPTRYSLHVLNTANTGASTVQFRGKQVSLGSAFLISA